MNESRAADTPMPRLVGGMLCLDFVNTVDPRHSEGRREFLRRYEDLVVWARHAGAATAEEETALLGEAARDPGAAARVYDEAIALREALYALLTPMDVGESRRRESLDTLNAALARASAFARIVHDDDRFRWAWAEAEERLDRVLWTVTRSAAGLLTSDALARVGECPGIEGTCGWLFLDTTKNATRRWCSMQFCGNRAKVRRHYARTRHAARRSAR